MADEDTSDPLDNPSVIYRENREQIETYLRQSTFYRMTGLFTHFAYYGGLFAFVNLLLAPWLAENLEAAVIGSILLGVLFGFLYVTGRHSLKQQRLNAAKQIGYSWEAGHNLSQPSKHS